ncbi:hypothetical protein G6F56_010739 [Rhizopus delemar]|nr:hypothetical protein G6F56_010739 [Rhizopus delemar]
MPTPSDDTSASAIIALEHYTLVPIVEPEIVKDNDRTFCLISDDESKFDWPDYLLQAESETEKQIWIDRLQTISRYSVSVLDKWLKRMEIIESEDPKKPRKYSRIHPQIEHHIIHPSQYNHEV